MDTVDGIVIVMSPWAVRELRFDESLGQMHGYDLDICLQARAAGKKVVTADFRVVHHHSLDLVGDPDGWVAAHMQLAEKWSEVLDSDAGTDWRRRARRAEAELELTRIWLHQSREQLTRLAQAYEGLERTRSWRLTAPLRALAGLARRIRHPTRAGRPPARGGRGPARDRCAHSSPRRRLIWALETTGSPRCRTLERASATPKALELSSARSRALW